MRRQTLNLYIDGLLSLSGDASSADARSLLIEEASEASDLIDLLSDWVWIQNRGLNALLELKNWFPLTYADLAKLFEATPREIGQNLRNLRAQELPPALESSGDAAQKASGFSCFMMEQHLSAWIDTEISDMQTLESLKTHLDLCQKCRQRLELFRDLQTQVLQRRQKFEPISEEEWLSCLAAYKRRRAKRMTRFLMYVAVIISVGTLFVWFLHKRPEETPNIYELPAE